MKDKWIQKSFESVYGQPCWGVHYDRQLGLSMNFGQPSLDIREPFDTTSESKTAQRLAAARRVTVRGEWWLWIYVCYWNIGQADQTTTRSSSLRRIESALQQLDGQRLISVRVTPTAGATTFEFDLGGTLSCRRISKTSQQDLWMLYKPRGYVLSVSGDGAVHHERSRKAN